MNPSSTMLWCVLFAIFSLCPSSSVSNQVSVPQEASTLFSNIQGNFKKGEITILDSIELNGKRSPFPLDQRHHPDSLLTFFLFFRFFFYDGDKIIAAASSISDKDCSGELQSYLSDTEQVLNTEGVTPKFLSYLSDCLTVSGDISSASSFRSLLSSTLSNNSFGAFVNGSNGVNAKNSKTSNGFVIKASSYFLGWSLTLLGCLFTLL